jgi:hypothetical protein
MQVQAPPASPTPFAQPVQESQQDRRERARIWVRFFSWYWGSSLFGLPILRIFHFAACLGCIAAVIVLWALGYVATQIAALLIGLGLLATYAIASVITQVYYSQYPGRYDLRLSEYVARRVSRLRRKDFIPRSESYSGTREVRALLNEVRATLRLELQRARREGEAGASALTTHGLLVTGPKHSAKKSVLWDAMRTELPGWTFVIWPHHMDHPANLAQRLGRRIVLWVEHLSDYASPGESAALLAFIQQTVQLGKQIIVLSSCREGKSLQVAQRYFAPLMAQLRPIKASETFTGLVTYAVSTTGELAAQEQTAEQIDRDQRIAVLKALGHTVQSSDLSRIEQDIRVKNQLAVLKALRWLKDAGALTFPYRVVQLFAQYFGFDGAAGSNWDETIAALSRPDHEFVRSAERADATARLESTPRSFFERHIFRLLRKPPPIVNVLIPMNVFNLPLIDTSFQQASKFLERDVNSVIERLNALDQLAIETLILLGDSYLSSQRGDERASSAQAVKFYSAARALLTGDERRRSFHTAWAATVLGQGNAALHQAQLRQGNERNKYLAQAADAFQALLTSAGGSATVAELPALSAQAYHGLGDIEYAYANVDSSSDSTHVEQHLMSAVGQYREVLQRLSPRDLFWNETQLNLANALQALTTRGASNLGASNDASSSDSSAVLPQIAHVQYIQEARVAYSNALLVYSRETSPAVWAEIQRCLADMHLLEATVLAHSTQSNTQSDRVHNIVGHIQGHYFAALTVFSPTYLPVNWAKAQFGLAQAFYFQANSEKAASPDAAEMSFDRASEALTASEEILSLLEMPLSWIETRLLRGRIALEKYALKPVENEGERQVKLQAIEVCREVLKDMRRVIRHPHAVATSHSGQPFAPSLQQDRRLKKLEDDLDELAQNAR